MATRGPWGGGGGWGWGEQNIALNVLLQILAPFFFFSSRENETKQNKIVLSVRKMNFIPNYSQHLAQCLV